MEPTLEGAMALAQTATGPLSPHLSAFIASLVEQRYTVISLRAKAWHAAAFDAWLGQEGVRLTDLSEAHIEQFTRRDYRPRSDCRSTPRRHEAPALQQLLRYLQAHGLCAMPAVDTLPADALLADFEGFLLGDRGLAASTTSGYRAAVREFLVDRFGNERVDLGALRATDVIRFLQGQPRRTRPHRLKHLVTALRAFLRWGEYCGEINAALTQAVPAVALWSTTPPLPRAIGADHARSAINSCDPGTTVGKRDRAVLLLLARLGLRGGEVLTLMLDDIDWDAGRLRVHGKNGRECLMPLPVDVGEAIAAYLQHGRPQSADRHLFLRVRAPIRGLLHGSDGIGSIVGNALERAGVDAPHKGAHQFRHALAVHMLKGGASLPEIGEVLRHRDAVSTSIYAKVDIAALRLLALPWPGSAS
ncbi:tyrosine-type recombinase/integrase [Pelomonas sp. Root1217]|uniref:tyrosine-type recombinase/integrase n=1 Tax=Pelomonas sp. Root1217 TaxID=1736430 RepID=UPI000A677159|nr:tyrosine-type recombinase/integrase [Pelomonas sp. Root1217]